MVLSLNHTCLWQLYIFVSLKYAKGIHKYVYTHFMSLCLCVAILLQRKPWFACNPWMNAVYWKRKRVWVYQPPSALKQPSQMLPHGTTMGAALGRDHCPGSPREDTAVPKGMDIADQHLQHPPRCGRSPPVPLDCLMTGLICQEIISHCPVTLRVKRSQPAPLHLQPETGD